MSKGLAPALSRSGLAQGPQHVDAVEFLPEFASDGLQQARLDEAQRGMESSAGGLFAGDPGDHGLVAEGFGAAEQFTEHQLPEALAVEGVVDEDRVFDRREPPLPGVIGRKGAPTDPVSYTHLTLPTKRIV